MLTRMRATRLKLGWTQRYLAAQSGINNTDISRIEIGRAKPYPKQATALAAALGLDPVTLQDEVIL